MAKSYLNQTNLPRGLRNNNPGNLIKTGIAWKGEVSKNTDGHFEQFVDLKHGIRALYKQLYTDIQVRSLNLRKLIHKYAPAHENNTENYIDYVSKKTGINPNYPIDLNYTNLVTIAKAIVSIENGSQYSHLISESDYEEAFSIAGLTIKKK